MRSPLGLTHKSGEVQESFTGDHAHEKGSEKYINVHKEVREW